MTLLLQVAALLFGAIIGSFLNALLFRFNTGRSVASGRSRCMQCGHELSALDLIPVLSYLLLRGRCRYCHARLSVQYPMVEAIDALLSLSIYMQHPVFVVAGAAPAYCFWFAVWMTLLFIVVYDLRHTIIPWSASGVLALLAIVHLFVSFDTTQLFIFTPNIWSLLAGPLLALPLFALSFVSGGKWMGWGDAPLELSLGWLLGLSLGGTALMLSFWIGAAVGILLIMFKKGLTMSSELPFAPFLVIGAGVAYFLHVDFFSSFPFLW